MNKDLLIVGIVIVVVGMMFMPISRISETKTVYTDQTKTVARGLCPPSILTSLETGNYHIEISEDKIIVGQDAMILVHDQSGNVIFQASLLESSDPISINHHYDFVAHTSGIHNITLEDGGGYLIEVTTTATVSSNVVAYPFELFFLRWVSTRSTGRSCCDCWIL